MSGYEHIEVRSRGRVLEITISRPHVMNALHPAAHRELGRAFDDFAADAELWVAVITGAGERAFCTGTDLKALAATGASETPDTGFAGLTSRFDLDKPVVAAVNGAALGGGLEIVLACDVAVAADHAVLGFPEPRVGLAALGGGLHRLARQIPLKHAMGIALTGRRLGAAEAHALGLVNEVVPADQLGAAVSRWVEAILECAPLAVQASKQVLRDSARVADLREAIAREYPAAARMLESGDAVEGPQAFAAKRRPRWSGR